MKTRTLFENDCGRVEVEDMCSPGLSSYDLTFEAEGQRMFMCELTLTDLEELQLQLAGFILEERQKQLAGFILEERQKGNS